MVEEPELPPATIADETQTLPDEAGDGTQTDEPVWAAGDATQTDAQLDAADAAQTDGQAAEDSTQTLLA